MRNIVSPLSGIRSPFGGRVDPYKVLGFKPALVADMSKDYFRNVSRQTFDDIFTTSRLGNATMVDSDGLLKWAPHNLLTYSEDFSNAAWVKVGGTPSANVETDPTGGTGMDALVEDTSTGLHLFFDQVLFETSVSYTVVFYIKEADRSTFYVRADTGAGTARTRFNFSTESVDALSSLHDSAEIVAIGGGIYKASVSFTETAGGVSRVVGIEGAIGPDVIYTGTGATAFYVWGAHLYRSDLGGMAPVPADARVAGSTTYVPTTSTAKYLPRRHNHVYDGSAWVDAGTLRETELRTQLLHTTNALVTQSHTVTAVPHTLHFTGTGTVTLSGASTAGPLVGTGTGEENRVSLTFTPTAASLTLTVTGTVTDAQLEVGSTPSSYIPNLAGSGTVLRAADSPLTIAGADVPWGSAVCIQMEGDMTYADTGVASEIRFLRWLVDGSNYIIADYATDGAYDRMKFEQGYAGTIDNVQNTSAPYSPGINVPFNIASRHGSTFINGAVDGTALTENTTPVALPDLSSTDLEIGYDFMGTIKTLRIWADDIGDAGLEASTT